MTTYFDMEVEKGIYDFRLQNDSSMLIVGPSKCGKSTFVLDLIRHKDKLFQHPIRNIWWFYGLDTPFHEQLEGVILKKGNISHDDFDSIGEFDLVILDDLQQELKQDQDTTNLFLKGVHHKKFFAIQINQYIYGDKDQRMRNANAHYFVLFQNPRNRQVAEFLTKMVPKGQGAVLHKVLNDIPSKYGYLFVDFTPECEDSHRLRTHIFHEPMTAFKLHTERSFNKMDYSRMVVMPENKYLALTEQTGGARQNNNPIVQHMVNEKRENEQVQSMMDPRKSYIEQLAKSIIKTTPTIDNMNHYNMRLTAFDNIRRKFFHIPTDKTQVQKPMVTRHMDTNTDPIPSRDMGTSPPSRKRGVSTAKSKLLQPKRYDTRASRFPFTHSRRQHLRDKENKAPTYPDY